MMIRFLNEIVMFKLDEKLSSSFKMADWSMI